ncbi:hypothetical protein EG329_008676 [Mollisiaceae sp. DMI_Dod_QoI]|nr:hypothetical protein EG329_008676 [Helotiales sp. DMI_Dod_QoI]
MLLKAEGSAVGKQVKPETPEPATPKPIPKLTLQDTKNESDNEDDDGDIRIKDPPKFKIKIIRLIKVAMPLIFKGKPSELKTTRIKSLIAGKATKAPKKKKIEAARPKELLKKLFIEKDY